jgi:DNA-binding NtrC family response regulator
MCREGSFREDLYYRLGVIQVTLPPLRERKDEIPLLIEYFGDEAAEKLRRQPVKLSRRLRTYLLNYAYPGNIRELRNIIFRISCLASDTADFEHLPEFIRPDVPELKQEGSGEGEQPQLSLADAKKAASDAAERQFLERGLQEQGGKVSELARQLDMNRSHLQTLLKKHGLSSKNYRVKS